MPILQVMKLGDWVACQGPTGRSESRLTPKLGSGLCPQVSPDLLRCNLVIVFFNPEGGCRPSPSLHRVRSAGGMVVT